MKRHGLQHAAVHTSVDHLGPNCRTRPIKTMIPTSPGSQALSENQGE